MKKKKKNILSLIFDFKKVKFYKSDKKIDDDFIGKISYVHMKNNKANFKRIIGSRVKKLTGHTQIVYSLAVLQDGSLDSGS